MTTLRVVIALCYPTDGGYLYIPDCPFCHVPHRHRLSNLRPLSTPHRNGEVIPYDEGMATKVSDCTDRGRTYALELREKSTVPQARRLVCRGVKKNGEACRKTVKSGYCVCYLHLSQQTEIAERCHRELTET